jgi:hypothetical protein
MKAEARLSGESMSFRKIAAQSLATVSAIRNDIYQKLLMFFWIRAEVAENQCRLAAINPGRSAFRAPYGINGIR